MNPNFCFYFYFNVALSAEEKSGLVNALKVSLVLSDDGFYFDFLIVF